MMEMEGVGRWPFSELKPPFDEELGLLLPADLVLIEPITSDHFATMTLRMGCVIITQPYAK